MPDEPPRVAPSRAKKEPNDRKDTIVKPLDALNQIAFRLERNGADTYKVRAFRGAARAIKDLPDDELEALAQAGPPPEHRGRGQVDRAGHRRGARRQGPRLPHQDRQGAHEGRPGGRRRRGRAARVPPGRLPLALRLVRRRQPHPRDGRGRPRPGPRLPRPDRPQRPPDRRPRAQRGAPRRTARARPRPQRAAGAVPHPHRDGGRHPRGRRRSTWTSTCSASSTSSWPASTPSCAWTRDR